MFIFYNKARLGIPNLHEPLKCELCLNAEEYRNKWSLELYTVDTYVSSVKAPNLIIQNITQHH